jgi:hypothetical protein
VKFAHFFWTLEDVRINRSKTGFSHHILNTGHAYDNLKMLNIKEKGPYLNTVEKFRIYKIKETGILINDDCADTYNPIFELLLQHK